MIKTKMVFRDAHTGSGAMRGNLYPLGALGGKAAKPPLMTKIRAPFTRISASQPPFFPTLPETAQTPKTLAKNAPHGERAPLKGSNLVEHEAPKMVTDAILFFVRSLAPPAQHHPKDAHIQRGYDIFKNIGCAQCHIPRLVTGPHKEYPWLSEKTIAPFMNLSFFTIWEKD